MLKKANNQIKFLLLLLAASNPALHLHCNKWNHIWQVLYLQKAILDPSQNNQSYLAHRLTYISLKASIKFINSQMVHWVTFPKRCTISPSRNRYIWSQIPFFSFTNLNAVAQPFKFASWSVHCVTVSNLHSYIAICK